jgi:Ca-activated chloride channel family protein
MTFFGYHIDHLWVLFLLPIAVGAFATAKYILRKRSTIAYPPLQYKTGTQLPKLLYGAMTALEVFLLIVSFISLAGPYKSFELVSIEEEGIDVALVVDISLSMQATDFTPNRLEATKKIVSDFVRKSGGNRVGIIVFAKHVFTLAPLTTDHSLLYDLIDGLSTGTIDHFASGGTAIGDAMLYSADMLNTAKIKNRDQVLVLLTDGESNDGMGLELPTKHAKSSGIKIHTIGIGSVTPLRVVPDPKDPSWSFETKLTEEPLIKIASETGGLYHKAEDGDVLQKIFDELARLERTPLKVDHFKQKKYYRYVFNFAAAVIFLAVILLRVLFLRRPLK